MKTVWLSQKKLYFVNIIRFVYRDLQIWENILTFRCTEVIVDIYMYTSPPPSLFHLAGDEGVGADFVCIKAG